MGQDWRPDEAVSPKLSKALFRLLEDKIAASKDRDEASHWVMAWAPFTFIYVFSLRGNEGLLADLKGIRDEYDVGRSHDPIYSTLNLLGQVKGEHHRCQHLMYSVDVTSLGISVRKNISDLILVTRELQGWLSGPAICDKEGTQWTTAFANEILHELLCNMFDQDPSLFPSHIGSHGDIIAKFHVYHSFRRASDSRAFSKEVALADIRVVNRWQKVEKAKGQRLSYDMTQHYAQIDLLIDCFLRYSKAMWVMI
jgi:hypothetical protein